MNGKLSNIGKWVFAALALVTVVLFVYFFMNADMRTERAGIILNWGYILIVLGIVCALISVIFTGIVKGVNVKTLLIGAVAIVVLGVVAYIMAKGCFDAPYQAGDTLYPGKTHGWVEFGLDFFYLTFGVSILAIIISVIYKPLKK